VDALDDLLAGGDDDEPLGGDGDDLLARVRAPAALDQPGPGGDLVGAVDRDVQRRELVERLDGQTQRDRRGLGRGRGRHAAQGEPARGQRGQQRRDRRAGAEPDAHPVLDQLGGELRGAALVRLGAHGRAGSGAVRNARRSSTVVSRSRGSIVSNAVCV